MSMSPAIVCLTGGQGCRHTRGLTSGTCHYCRESGMDFLAGTLVDRRDRRKACGTGCLCGSTILRRRALPHISGTLTRSTAGSTLLTGSGSCTTAGCFRRSRRLMFCHAGPTAACSASMLRLYNRLMSLLSRSVPCEKCPMDFKDWAVFLDAQAGTAPARNCGWHSKLSTYRFPV